MSTPTVTERLTNEPNLIVELQEYELDDVFEDVLSLHGTELEMFVRDIVEFISINYDDEDTDGGVLLQKIIDRQRDGQVKTLLRDYRLTYFSF